jgi:hypothetical protein
VSSPTLELGSPVGYVVEMKGGVTAWLRRRGGGTAARSRPELAAGRRHAYRSTVELPRRQETYVPHTARASCQLAAVACCQCWRPVKSRDRPCQKASRAPTPRSWLEPTPRSGGYQSQMIRPVELPSASPEECFAVRRCATSCWDALPADWGISGRLVHATP